MTAALTLARLNGMDRAGFAAVLGHVFENSPWVAERSWPARPFADIAALHEAMVAAVRDAGDDERLKLIRAHPDLAPKLAAATELTPDSRAEQTGAGLDRCTPAEHQRFQELNAGYKAKFGFPFVIAVKGLDRQAILEAFEARLGNDRETEFAEAIGQIGRIAGVRLADLVAP